MNAVDPSGTSVVLDEEDEVVPYGPLKKGIRGGTSSWVLDIFLVCTASNAVRDSVC